ncbi:MAG TPA: hypothetical protein VF625_08815, partial [Longimicrobium sp.]
MSSRAAAMARPASNPWDAPRPDRAERRERRRGFARRAFFVVLVLAALASVVWRQTVGYERERQLAEVRAELAVA